MAEMWTLILKNSTGADISVDNLGIIIPTGSQIQVSSQYSYSDIASSDDLRVLVANGSLIVNNGTIDLPLARALEYITIYNQDQAKQDFYTKTNLQTPGQSTIHFNNITNVPSFGASNWEAPARARVTAISATPPTTPAPVLGDIYANTGDNHLYNYNGTTWVDLGILALNDQVVSLASATQDLFKFNGTILVDEGLPVDMSGINIKDDGDGKQAQYIYVASLKIWRKIADVDFGVPNTLGGAYDQGGAGLGRTINAISGAVKIDTVVATSAPIELTEKTLLPTTGLAPGQLAIVGGILYVYDGIRSKFLSVGQQTIAFGRAGNSINQYLGIFGASNLPSNNTGIRIDRNSTIISLSAQIKTSGTCTLIIRKNGSTTMIAQLVLTAQNGNQDTTLNVDVNAGDYLQAYIMNTTAVSNPVLIVKLANR